MGSGRLCSHLPAPCGAGAAASPAVRADLRGDSRTALPPCQKLVSCFSCVFNISLLKLNVFLNSCTFYLNRCWSASYRMVFKENSVLLGPLDLGAREKTMEERIQNISKDEILL